MDLTRNFDGARRADSRSRTPSNRSSRWTQCSGTPSPRAYSSGGEIEIVYYPEYEIATPIEGAEGVLRFSVPKRRPISGQTVLICNLHLEKASRLTVTVSVNGVVVYRSNDASAWSTIMAAFPEELMGEQEDNIIEVALGGGRPVWISDVLVLYNVPESLVPMR